MKSFTLAKSLVLTVFGLILITPAHAEESKRDQQIEEKFKAADTNHDGKLTLVEAKSGMPRVARGFSKIDADNKGYVTVDEIKAMANH
jgi:Ca2+-binding EF-hand superfamily protein